MPCLIGPVCSQRSETGPILVPLYQDSAPSASLHACGHQLEDDQQSDSHILNEYTDETVIAPPQSLRRYQQRASTSTVDHVSGTDPPSASNKKVDIPTASRASFVKMGVPSPPLGPTTMPEASFDRIEGSHETLQKPHSKIMAEGDAILEGNYFLPRKSPETMATTRQSESNGTVFASFTFHSSSRVLSVSSALH